MASKQFIVKHGMDVKRNDGTSSLSIASDTGNMTVGQALETNSTLTAGGKLTVSAGGADVAGNLDAQGGLTVTGGNLTVTNNLIVSGTTTTVNSTIVTIKDPVMTLGGDSDPIEDDNKDRGIEFRYYDGSAKRGFMGFDDSEGKFRFLTDATNTGEVFSGTDATLVAAIEGNASTATALAAAGQINLQAGDINAVSASSADGNYDLTVTIANNKITLGKLDQLADMTVMGNVSGGTANVAAITIDSDMAGGVSASHDSLASAKTIKAYVDAQLAGTNSIQEQTDVEITGTLANGEVLIWDATAEKFENKAMSGDVTMTLEGVTTIGAGTVHNPMLEHDSVSFGGVSVDLGAASAQPAFDLTNATDYPTSSLTGTITNAQLAGSIANDKLANPSLTIASANAALTATAGATALGGTSTLTVVVDDSSIQIDGGLKVKAHGIKEPHIDWGTGANQVSTANIPEDTNLYYTDARVHAAVSAVDAGGDGSFSETNGVFTYTGPSAAEARAHVSATDAGGDGSFSYDSGTGVFTYTGPSAAEARAHVDASANDGLTYTEATGEFSLAQDIQATASPTFAGLNITGNLAIAGTTTTVNSATMEVEDSLFLMAKNNGANLTDIGIAAPFNDGSAKFAAFFRDADDSGVWKLAETAQSNISTTNAVDTTHASFAKGTLSANLIGDVTGAVTGTVSSIANHDTGDLTEGANLYYTDARVHAAVSAVDGGGDGSFSETNGVFTYTGPSAAETRAHLSATAPMAYNSTTGVISIAADTDDVTEAGNLYYTDARVRLNRLDQMAAPTAAVALNAQKITGLADGAAAQDAVTKAQLDAVAAGTSMGGLTDTTISNPADAHVVIYDNGTSKWENQVMTGDVTMTKDGVTSIGATKITDAMIIGAGLANSSLATPNVTIATAANSALTGVGTVDLGATLTLNVATDGSSLETDSDTLRVKALGITDGMLAGSISNAKLVDIANAKLVNSTISGKELGTNLDSLTDGNGIADFTFNGSGAASIALELESADALEVGASGLDLKDTIAGARTFSAKLTASAGVDTGSETSTSGAYTMTAAAEQVANTFAHATFRSAKYVAQVTNQAGSEYQCSELLVIHNGTTASVAEYGLMHTGAAALATFDVGINGANVELKATAGNGDVIKFSRSTLVI